MEPRRISYGDAGYPKILSALLGDAAPPHLTFIGNPALLNLPLLGFFCSRKAPGGVIIRAYDWARAARDAHVTVIGGFQSPMERECLDILLRGMQPVVVCPARAIGAMRIPREWRKAIEHGRLLVLSPFDNPHRRVTARLAARRNRFVAALAQCLLIAYASPGGTLGALMQEGWGKPVQTFDDLHRS